MQDIVDAAEIEQFPLRSKMRKLWEDHVTWTRMYIVSVAAGLPDKDLVAQRLLQNQVDIGSNQFPETTMPKLLPQTGAADHSSYDSSAAWLALLAGPTLVVLGQLLRKRNSRVK